MSLGAAGSKTGRARHEFYPPKQRHQTILAHDQSALGKEAERVVFFRPLNAKRARQDQNATEGPKTRRRLPAPSPEKQVLPTSSTCSPWSPLEQRGGTREERWRSSADSE